jgi:quercetin 2,3-dioxygenase
LFQFNVHGFPVPELCIIKSQRSMDRKDFLRKGLLGTSMLTASPLLAKLTENGIDELRPLDVVGFNHLPSETTKIMANTILHKAATRGGADHGWLKAKHTFSFANYYDPERMHFGVLRVLNDDRIAAGRGFGTHPHDNMEIITIPLSGTVAHKDSMGNSGTISPGEVQVMSAGTGITHSEFNHKQDEELRLLQIWLFPDKRGVVPRYDQLQLKTADRHNNLQQVLSPSKEDAGVWIHQNAWFHMGTFDKDFKTTYTLKDGTNGVYAFVIKGDITINGNALNERDGLGLWELDKLDIQANSQDAELLLMEVPMHLS